MSISQNYPLVTPSLSLDFANTKKLDPRITFSRPTTGAYYDGKTVAKAEENLLLQSQSLATSPWIVSGLTATNNSTTAPDGTTTATALIETATTAIHVNTQAPALTTLTAYTVSFYAKPNGRNFVYFTIYSTTSSNNINVSFNVSTGAVTQTNAVGTGYAVTSSSITTSTNGYYRCVVNFTTGTATPATLFIGVSDSATFAVDNFGRYSYTGDGVSGVYIWGAQLEQRSSVTAYQPTTTQPITNYIPVLLSAPANVARFDHNPVTGESLGLLVEEQSTNLTPYSEDFANASWTKSDVTAVQSNAIIAPDGTLTGDKVILTGGLNGSIGKSISFTAGVAYTASVFAKEGGFNTIAFTVAANAAVEINLTTGASNITAQLNGWTVSNVLRTAVGNNWYRVSATFTAGTTVSAVTRLAEIRLASGNGFYGIFFWGAQLEAGAFPTSYVKTVASQVTRSADSASMVGANFSSWYRADEGSIYGEVVTSNLSGNKTIANFSDSTPNGEVQRIQIRLDNSTGASTFICATAGTVSAGITNGTYISSGMKVICVYKVNDFAISANGATVSTDTSGVVPMPTELRIGNKGTAFNEPLNGHIKKLSYYPQRLSNLQLQALTS